MLKSTQQTLYFSLIHSQILYRITARGPAIHNNDNSSTFKHQKELFEYLRLATYLKYKMYMKNSLFFSRTNMKQTYFLFHFKTCLDIIMISTHTCVQGDPQIFIRYTKKLIC